jgi:hypothetical protein
MAAPSYVLTIARVAKMLGEDEAVTAFTPFGVENLKELVEEHKRQAATRRLE